MRGLIKNIALLLSCMMLIVTLPGIGMASERTYYNESVFEYILFDYVILTGNTEQVAREYYEELMGKIELDRPEIYIEENLEISGGLLQEIIYIQDNYDQIVARLNTSEKESLDKYILDLSLKYYYGKDLPEKSISAFENVNVYQLDQAAPKSVATLRISSDISDEHTLGSSSVELVGLGKHAWIVITNISKSTIQVGKLSVGVGESITVGTYGTDHGHAGIWFNYDGYFAHTEDAYTDNNSYTMSISQSQLDTINSVILDSSNDTWTYLNNCSTFSTEVWNSVASTTFSAGIINTPKTLYNNIAKKSGYKHNMTIPFDGDVYYGASNPTLWTN